VNTAVIDLGTNTLLLLIVDETGKALVDLCRFGRLGQGLDATGRLAEAAIARSLAICDEYRRVLNEYGVVRPAVIATQATREAANAADFVGPAEAILGAPIEVIAGTREAELAFLAVARTFPELAGTPFVVDDVGGGSTELVVTDGTRVNSAVSVPIGSVRLTERHLKHDPPTRKKSAPRGHRSHARAARVATDHGDRDCRYRDDDRGAEPIATYDPDAVTGVQVSRPEVEAQLARLLAATVEQRKAMRGMEEPRADVIAAGVAIYARVLERTGSSLITCDRGIRWGIAYEQLASTASGSRASPEA
jgi:exopolyphosphatase/guanosine-5'-triphosphate,3'-diphosphate pyrophosphatase